MFPFLIRQLADTSGISRLRRDWEAGQPVADDEFDVQLTAYDSITGHYSWTEQTYSATGGFSDKPGGRSGTALTFPAKTFNGEVITGLPKYARIRKRIPVASYAMVYEIINPPPTSGAITYVGGAGATLTPSGNPYTNTSTLISGVPTGRLIMLGYIEGTIVAASGNEIATQFVFRRGNAGINFTLNHNYYAGSSAWVFTLPVSLVFTSGAETSLVFETILNSGSNITGTSLVVYADVFSVT